MKKISFLSLFLWLITFSNLSAQTHSGQLNGVITDVQNQPLNDVNVKLVLQKDASTVKAVSSDQKGRFDFKDLPNNTYFLICSYLGYTLYKTTAFTIDDTHQNITLPLIALTTDKKMDLKEVVVTARKPLIQYKNDKTIVNVDAMSTAAGSNIMEVLNKSPGVSLDGNGDITLDGKGNVLVLIDEKPTYLATQDLAAYLKSLPAGIVEKLELISNPSSKYDASSGAIINIVLKKNKLVGFNGNINAGYEQGSYPRSNNALNLNYRYKKLSIFSNLSYSHDQNYTNINSQRHFYDTNGSTISTIKMDTKSDYVSNGYNTKIGMDYFLSSKTILGVLLLGNTRPKSSQLNSVSQQYDSSQNQTSYTDGNSHGNYYWKNAGVNLNMQHKFDTIGKSLSADIDIINYKSGSSQIMTNQNIFPDNTLNNTNTVRYDLPSKINIYAIKSDYTQPINDKSRFNAGLKSSFVNYDNTNNLFDVSGGVFQQNYQNSNHFLYQENTNAIYVNYDTEGKRWAFQSGIRIENSRTKGQLLANIAVSDTTFSKNNTHLFPSLYASYKLDSKGNNNLIFNYNTRVKRPNYQQLNPFLLMIDNYTYAEGNTNLSPHFTNVFSLKYAYKNTFGVTFSYLNSNHIISTLTKTSGDTLITKPENFGSNYSWNLIPYLSLRPSNYWNLQASGMLFYLVNKGDAYGQSIDDKVVTGEIELNNQFELGKGWSAEANGFYAGKHIGGQTITDPIWRIDASLQKNILKNKGTIRLKVNDIFYTLTRHETTIGLENQTASRYTKSDTRAIGISFNYRFGKITNLKKSNHNNGGAEDEKVRTN